jgi:hypothetical protein
MAQAGNPPQAVFQNGRMCLMARSTIPTRSSPTRVETGCFGSIGLAADHRGARTERARQNFRIGRDRMPLSIIRALRTVKQAAEANGARSGRATAPSLAQRTG